MFCEMHEILVLVVTLHISVFALCQVVKNMDCELNLNF